MMITKNDWTDALDAWAEEERERLGGPPSPEEVVAYLSGELSGAAAERVRALLVYDPELTPLLDEHRFGKPRKSYALPTYAVAATLTIALLAPMLIHERRKSMEPAVVSSSHELNPFRTRGGVMTYELPAGERHSLITVVPSKPPSEDTYRIEIAREREVLWSARDVRPVDDVFAILVPGELLQPGTYTLKIYAGSRLIDIYPIRVVPR